jgi:tRNA (cmo5U34)-methyltransferase
MTNEHRVATHLGVTAGEYDAEIRRFIPAYEQMVATVVELVRGRPVVVDLGAGTGALGGAILDAIADAKVVMIDIDPAMLEVARARTARHGGRVELRRQSFDHELPRCDAVVASLALHHIPERDHKCEVYRRIREVLRPGGVLVVADITLHAEGVEHRWGYDMWAAAMATHGIDRAAADALFGKWAAEDFLTPLATELVLLGEAGFAHPECFWKQGPSTVFGGFV